MVCGIGHNLVQMLKAQNIDTVILVKFTQEENPNEKIAKFYLPG